MAQMGRNMAQEEILQQFRLGSWTSPFGKDVRNDFSHFLFVRFFDPFIAKVVRRYMHDVDV